jgi:hypothetical protein
MSPGESKLIELPFKIELAVKESTVSPSKEETCKLPELLKAKFVEFPESNQ